MDLVLRVVEHDGVPVLGVHGEVDLATLPRLRDQLVRLVTAHPGSTVVVDLDAVTALDDTGLGVLVGGLGRARTHGGDLTLVCNSARILEMLQLCRLDRVFDIHPSVTAALWVSEADQP